VSRGKSRAQTTRKANEIPQQQDLPEFDSSSSAAASQDPFLIDFGSTPYDEFNKLIGLSPVTSPHHSPQTEYLPHLALPDRSNLSLAKHRTFSHRQTKIYRIQSYPGEQGTEDQILRDM